MGAKKERDGVLVVQRAQAPTDDKRGAISKALPDDGWNYTSTGPNAVVEPLFKPDKVCEWMDTTQALRSVTNAVVTNVHLMGHTWVPLRKPVDDKQRAGADVEKKRLERWFRQCNPRLGWPELRKRFGTDKEACAYALFEVLRNLAGDVSGLAHRPARTFRMTAETDPVEANFKRFDEETGAWIDTPYEERFRRWVQRVNGQYRYFSEFGDPRCIDSKTGQWMKDGSGKPITDRKKLSDEQVARLGNEVLWAVTYDPLSEYGTPWFLGLANDIESDYQASDTTRDYLADGAIPKVVFVFRACQLKGSSEKAFKAALEGARGNHAANRAVLLEAVPMAGTPDSPGAAADARSTGFDVVKLNDLQQGDALFREFRKDHEERVRVARRLPGIFIGKDDAANYATATVQVQMGISQVFRPEQQQFDDMINGAIMPALDAVWWQFRSLGPTLEDNATWIAAIRIAIDSGAIPDYQTLRRVLSEVLGFELPSGDDKGQIAEWEKMPPGFVVQLFRAIQGFPQFSDLADTLPVDAETKAGTSRAVERMASAFVAAAPAIRKQLVAAGEVP